MQNKEIVIDEHEVPVRPSTGGKHKLTPKERGEIIAAVEQADEGENRFFAYISKATEVLNRTIDKVAAPNRREVGRHDAC